MSLLKTNEIQNYNGSSLTLTASTVSTSAQLNTGGNISVTGSLNVSDDSTTRTNLGLGTIATQDSNNVNLTGGTIGSGVTFPADHIIQIVESQTTYKTVSTSAFSDVTGLSAGITITSGNQIYFQCEFGILQISNDSEIVITDSANTIIFTLVSFNSTQTLNGTITTPLVTPSSTTVTYKVRAKISSGTIFFGNFSANTTPLLFRIYEVQQ